MKRKKSLGAKKARLASVTAILDARAVTAAKKTVSPFAIPLTDLTLLTGKRFPAQTFGVIARMIETPEEYCPSTFLAKVQVVMTTVPELPDVVTLEGKVFVLVESAPLTYIQRTASEATRV